MDKETFEQKIKHLVYKIVLPIYLWSIGEKTLESYITGIEQEYEGSRKIEVDTKATEIVQKRKKHRHKQPCPVTGKRSYSRKGAKRKAKKETREFVNIRAYRCEFCPHWHITHKKRYKF